MFNGTTRPLDVDICITAVAGDLWKSLTVQVDDGCLQWVGYIDKRGYGRFSLNKLTTATHRIALVAKLGRDILPGYTAGHKCHDAASARGECAGGVACLHRRCVNPEHLSEESSQDNSHASANSNARRTHCPAGHLLDGDNLVAAKAARGERGCRTCAVERDRVRTAVVSAAREATGLIHREYVERFGKSRATAEVVLLDHGINPEDVIAACLARWSAEP